MSKVVVITGAGGVLCSTLAKALAAEGHQIAVLDLKKEAADTVVEEIKAVGGTAIGITANVLEKESLIAAKKKFTDVQRWKYLTEREPPENIEESLEKFLQKTRVEYRRGRLLTFKGWVGLVKELLDELD